MPPGEIGWLPLFPGGSRRYRQPLLADGTGSLGYGDSRAREAGIGAGRVHYVSTTLALAVLARPQNYAQELVPAIDNSGLDAETIHEELAMMQSNGQDRPWREIGLVAGGIGVGLSAAAGAVTCSVSFSCV